MVVGIIVLCRNRRVYCYRNTRCTEIHQDLDPLEGDLGDNNRPPVLIYEGRRKLGPVRPYNLRIARVGAFTETRQAFCGFRPICEITTPCGPWQARLPSHRYDALRCRGHSHAPALGSVGIVCSMPCAPRSSGRQRMTQIARPRRPPRACSLIPWFGRKRHSFVPICQSAERRAQMLSRMPLCPGGAGAQRPGQHRARR